MCLVGDLAVGKASEHPSSFGLPRTPGFACVSPIPQREASAWKGFPGSWLLGDIWLLSCVYSLPLQRDMNPSYGFSKPHSLQTQSLRSGLQLEGALANSEPERLAGCSLPVLPPQATGWQRRPGLGWLGGMGVGEGSRGFLSLRP